MRTKKTVEQKKNRNSQKSVESVQLMGMGVYWGKDFWKRYVFSLEWKSEGVMDDDSGDSEEDEGEEDWLRQGWRSKTHRRVLFVSASVCAYPKNAVCLCRAVLTCLGGRGPARLMGSPPWGRGLRGGRRSPLYQQIRQCTVIVPSEDKIETEKITHGLFGGPWCLGP